MTTKPQVDVELSTTMGMELHAKAGRPNLQEVIDLRSNPRPSPGFSSAPSVTVVVPTKNEAGNLPHVLPLIPDWVAEVIIVDAASDDGTAAVAQQLLPDARVIVEPRKGKGIALRTGFEAATSEFIVALDADGSADPTEIPALIGALLAGADVAKGTRFMQGGGTTDMEYHRMFGNWVLTQIVNKLFHGRYSDLCYGFFALRRSALPSLLKADDHIPGFEIETFLNIRALKANLSIREVPSFEFDRINGTSNLNAFFDGFRILRVIIAEFFDRPTSSPTLPSTDQEHIIDNNETPVRAAYR